jgi:hypothetical protein
MIRKYTKEAIMNSDIKNLLTEAEGNNNPWEFVSKLDKVTLFNLSKILPQEQREDYDVTTTQAIVRYSLKPNFYEGGLDNISVTPISVQIIIGYYYYDQNNNESPEQTITINTTNTNFQYEFNTKYLKFGSDGSFSVNGIELTFDTDKKITIGLN